LTIFTPLFRTTPLGAVLFVTVKLQEPEKKELPQVEDRGEDEHSDLMQEEEPVDLIARDTGAHFTHPVAQKRGLITPTSPEEKPTASPLGTDDDAKLPAAFIAPNLFTNLQTSKSLNQETLCLSFLPSFRAHKNASLHNNLLQIQKRIQTFVLGTNPLVSSLSLSLSRKLPQLQNNLKCQFLDFHSWKPNPKKSTNLFTTN